MTETLVDPSTLDSDLKDENRFAHYAEKVSVTEGYVLGTPVLAVCGKLFIPSRDPKKFPLCPICKKISEALFFSKE
jgi:hypothetical protein